MKIVHSLEKKIDYLYFTISGEYNRADFTSYAALILKECGKHAVRMFLRSSLHWIATPSPIKILRQISILSFNLPATNKVAMM